MKKNISVLFALLLSLCFCNTIDAHHVMCFGEFSIKGLDYSYFDNTKTSVYVTFAHASHLDSTKAVIPDTVEWLGKKYPVVSVASEAFHHCPEVDGIHVAPTIDNIGYQAFVGTAWENNLPEGVIYTGNNVYKYNGTMPENAKITIKEGTRGITQQAFDGCTNLQSISLPESVTRLHADIFKGCTGLKEITIMAKEAPVDFAREVRFDTEALPYEVSNTDVRNATLIIPKGSMDSYVKAGYKDIVKEIVEKDFNKFTFEVVSETELTARIFGNKNFKLTGEIILPETTEINGKTYKVVAIGADAFAGSENLEKVTIPAGVKEIGERAFAQCTALVTVVIPESVDNIATNAFEGCTKLDKASQEAIVRDAEHSIYIIGAIIVVVLLLVLLKRIRRRSITPKKECKK